MTDAAKRIIPDGYKPNAVPKALKVVIGHEKENEIKGDVKRMEETKLNVLNEVKGVAYVGFKVSDVQRAVPWYVTNLGCEIRQQHDGLGILKLPWGPDIELYKANPDDLDKSVPFGLYVENVEKYHGLLKENGVKVNEIVDQGGCGLMFKMYDPDENEITVWGGYKGKGEGKPDNWIY